MPSRARIAAAGATALVAIPSAVTAAACVVHPEDTLGDIAVRHGTTVQALLQENGLERAQSLRPGQLLRIPDARLSLPLYARGADDVEVHRVGAGEGVIQVARRFGVDPTALARSNGIGVNAPLAAGDVLQVPGRLARGNALITLVAGEARAAASLVRAVAWAESEWRQDRVGPTGAVGMMQLEPFAGDWVSQHLAGRRLDIRVARDNVLAGALLLRHLAELHEGDLAATVAAYYQGAESLDAHGLHGDTRGYRDRVLALLALED